MSLIRDFAADNQGRRFKDVMDDTRIPFRDVLRFFDRADVRCRMVDSEIHHDRPALAGAVRELEAMPFVHDFFRNHDGQTTTRFRQAVGVAVRIVMEKEGWKTTGRKGSLGVRVPHKTPTTLPGAYHNVGGLALWFTRAERYELLVGMPYRDVTDRAAELSTVAG